MKRRRATEKKVNNYKKQNKRAKQNLNKQIYGRTRRLGETQER